MNKSDDLASLIERLERASGPDRELDIDICTAIGKTRLAPGFQTAPHYTSSIDAALTLVPDGWIAVVSTNGMASVENKNKKNLVNGPASATPAIALCIAALRARA